MSVRLRWNSESGAREMTPAALGFERLRRGYKKGSFAARAATLAASGTRAASPAWPVRAGRGK